MDLIGQCKKEDTELSKEIRVVREEEEPEKCYRNQRWMLSGRKELINNVRSRRVSVQCKGHWIC